MITIRSSEEFRRLMEIKPFTLNNSNNMNNWLSSDGLEKVFTKVEGLVDFNQSLTGTIHLPDQACQRKEAL